MKSRFNVFLEEGVHDPGILRAFFMAGGPGSGKSHVAAELFGIPKSFNHTVSYSTGLKIVGSDIVFEKKLRDTGYDPKDLEKYISDEEMWNKIMKIRDEAKYSTEKMKENYIAGRLGLIIDGTGKDVERIKTQKTQLENLGYDTYMIFVNTPLDIALKRNKNRDRTLPENVVKDAWYEAQENLGKFQKMFGLGSLIIVDNARTDNEAIRDVEKEIRKILRNPIKNPIGLKWIKEH